MEEPPAKVAVSGESPKMGPVSPISKLVKTSRSLGSAVETDGKSRIESATIMLLLIESLLQSTSSSTSGGQPGLHRMSSFMALPARVLYSGASGKRTRHSATNDAADRTRNAAKAML